MEYGTRHDHRKAVKSVVVGPGRLFHAGRQVPHNDRRSRHYGSALVGDAAAERARQYDILGSQ